MMKQTDKPKRYTINQLVDRFYKSKFNRDQFVPVGKNEDENNSRKHRLYNKGDIRDLIELFVEFIEWVLIEDNVENIWVNKNISLIREAELPRIKMASVVDKRILGDSVEVGKYYATKGRYSWKMWITNELYKQMMQLWQDDPDRKQRVDELNKELEKRNEGK